MTLVQFCWVAFAFVFACFVIHGIIDWLTERRMSDGKNLIEELKERHARR